jgi:hypothetical protein
MDPLTSKLRELSSVTLDSLISLLSSGQSLYSPDSPSFSDAYDEWPALKSIHYKSRFVNSLRCFPFDPSPELLSEIARLSSTIPDLSFKSLVSLASKSVGSVREVLFASDLILRANPSLFNPEITSDSIVEEGPILRWLIGRVITGKYCTVSADSLVELFVDALFSEEESMASVSVAAVHLFVLSAARRNPIRAKNYCKLIELSQRPGGPRGEHVARGIVHFMKTAYPKDMGNFPRELLLRFPEAPSFVRKFFSQGAMHSEEFLLSWVKIHPEMREASMNYLRILAKTLPLTVLAHFPAADWRTEAKAAISEQVHKKVKSRKTVMTVGVWVLVAAVIGAFYLFYK